MYIKQLDGLLAELEEEDARKETEDFFGYDDGSTIGRQKIVLPDHPLQVKIPEANESA